MKRFIFFLIMFTPIVVSAQKDYCKHVKRDVDDMKGKVLISSPISSTTPWVAKVITKETTEAAIVFTAYGASSDYRAKGLFIKFEDSTIVKEEQLHVDCSYEDTYTYRYSATYTLNADNVEKFKTMKVIKVQLDDYNRIIGPKTGEELMEYVKCIWDAK